MSAPILDHPVAKKDDPITSYEAGESTAARTIAHKTVLYLLATHGEATQGHIVEDAKQLDVPASPERIRSSFSELESKGFTERTGTFDKSGGRRKELWRLTEDGRKEAQS